VRIGQFQGRPCDTCFREEFCDERPCYLESVGSSRRRPGPGRGVRRVQHGHQQRRGGASRVSCPRRQPGCRGDSADPGRAGRRGRALHRVAVGRAVGLASVPAVDSDSHAVCRGRAAAPRAGARRRTDPTHLLPRTGWRRRIRARPGRIRGVQPGRGRRRVLPVLPPRPGGRVERRARDAPHRRRVAEHERPLVARRPTTGLRLHAAQRAGRRPVAGRAPRAEKHPVAGGTGRRRLVRAGLVARRTTAPAAQLLFDQQGRTVAAGCLDGRQDSAGSAGRGGPGGLPDGPLPPRRPGRLRHDGPGLGVPAVGRDRPGHLRAPLPEPRHPVGRGGVRTVAGRQDHRPGVERGGPGDAAADRGFERTRLATAGDARWKRLRVAVAPGRPRTRLHADQRPVAGRRLFAGPARRADRALDGQRDGWAGRQGFFVAGVDSLEEF